ncbi:membrane-associated protein, putative [Bodo saltans]|uniref:Membrane-associated protein, putative n=1 Tax=Bodo saltans TaxID=75058 RepID=A0A0S4IYP7_BODSA|nr:membrane-associated protein, putative [Bodo saltans]|eukprot:CUF79046.1 membrane-associated protein, putative [Bodo saltans]
MMPKSKLRLAVVVIVSLLLLLAMWTLSSTTYVPSLTILPLHVTEHNPDDDRPMDNMLDHKKRTFDALSTSLAGPKTNADAPQPTIPGTSMRWTPGGVVGASLQTVESELDRLFELFYVKYFFGQGGNIASSTWCHASRKAAESPIYPIDEVPQSWAVLEGAMKTLQNITLQHNDDCRVHLALHHRAMCFIAAALDDGSGDDCSFATTTQTEKEKVQQQRGGFVPLHQRCAYRTSYCAQLMPCLSWTRGTIEVLPRLTTSAVRFDAQEGEGQGHERVSPGLLRHVYQSTISPRLKKPPPTGNSRLLLRNPDGAFVRHQKLFLHGDVACIDDSSMPLTTLSTTSETASRPTSCMNMADESVLLPRLQEQEAYLNFTHELQASEYRRPLTRKNKKAQFMLPFGETHTNARKIDPTTAPPQSSVSSSNTALEQRIQINTPQPVCHLFHGTRVVAAAHTAAVSTTPSSIINRAHRSTLSDRGGDRSDDVADARRRASLDRGNDHPSSEERADDDSVVLSIHLRMPQSTTNSPSVLSDQN